MPTDVATLSAFDRLYEEATRRGGEINYTLAPPRWQFLCHLADTHDVLLHGSGDPNISVFEPRKSDDVSAFGDRKAVYSAGDGIWPIYFAILDRDAQPMTLINSAMRIEDADGSRSEPYYFFSISDSALKARAFRRGTIYLLPRAGSEQQAPRVFGGRTVWLPQWANLEPVQPFARLAVGPEDSPFLAQLRGHNDEATFAKARANPDAFPWLD